MIQEDRLAYVEAWLSLAWQSCIKLEDDYPSRQDALIRSHENWRREDGAEGEVGA